MLCSVPRTVILLWVTPFHVQVGRVFLTYDVEEYALAEHICVLQVES